MIWIEKEILMSRFLLSVNNLKYYLYFLILLSPFLLVNDKEMPIVERGVLYDSYEIYYRMVVIYAYDSETKAIGSWSTYTQNLKVVKSLKQGQTLTIKSEKCNEKGGCGRVLSLFDGEDYLINEEG
ncbi:hypothetical protein [Pseudoalteromonas sp. PS5]|uniref:hypothetical protein n=1 Tax=Pseudoalteromonas sp. PS5 TaxID=1437473 RepID=UPI000FFE3E02|nr:hypothetical protein [Pseudoalteromonas sp. PS5]RXF05195.1 hypothetical protein D9603_04305 [Pseudoalteromonas sp. PS5]